MSLTFTDIFCGAGGSSIGLTGAGLELKLAANHWDRAIETHAANWSLDRLPDVDRAILRMATYELLWADDVPDAVVIDEAVELAKTLSTDESPKYVNGVLGAILAAEVPTA